MTVLGSDGKSIAGEPDPPDPTVLSVALRSLNRLTKWKAVFSGWQLGTRPIGDPESDAVRDHREISLILRAEVTALSRILVEKHLMTRDDLNRAIGEEAEYLADSLSLRFPGFRATDDGMEMDGRAVETTKGWNP